FGLMQVKVGLISLLSKYQFSVSKKTAVPLTFDKKTIILSAVGGMWLQIRKRTTSVFTGHIPVLLNLMLVFSVLAPFMKSVFVVIPNLEGVNFFRRICHPHSTCLLKPSLKFCVFSNSHLEWCMEYHIVSVIVWPFCRHCSLPRMPQLLTWHPTLLSALFVVIIGEA
ncbi:hypothetical protein Cfor_01699, partial [Coptotermes formosanus]